MGIYLIFLVFLSPLYFPVAAPVLSRGHSRMLREYLIEVILIGKAAIQRNLCHVLGGVNQLFTGIVNAGVGQIHVGRHTGNLFKHHVGEALAEHGSLGNLIDSDGFLKMLSYVLTGSRNIGHIPAVFIGKHLGLGCGVKFEHQYCNLGIQQQFIFLPVIIFQSLVKEMDLLQTLGEFVGVNTENLCWNLIQIHFLKTLITAVKVNIVTFKITDVFAFLPRSCQKNTAVNPIIQMLIKKALRISCGAEFQLIAVDGP